jgi:hypothetical protein
MSAKTYQGSCHCGKVRYSVEIDFDGGTGRCNCSICSKLRKWGTIVKPEAFTLISGVDDVTIYQFGTKQGEHRFCKHCGVHAYGVGYLEVIGGAYVSINVACLDDIAQEDLAAVPVRYMDGRGNNWFETPAVTSHL